MTYPVTKHIGFSWLVHRLPLYHPLYLHMQVQRCDLGQCDAFMALAAGMRNDGHEEHGIAGDVETVTYKMNANDYLSYSRTRPADIHFRVGISIHLHQCFVLYIRV